MKRISTSGTTSSSKLELVCERVLDGWFPLDPALLRVLRRRLDEGYYEDSTDTLRADLSQDFSLYTFCLKELVRLARERGANPEQAFATASLREFKQILSLDEGMYSAYPLYGMSPEQAARLAESMVSAETARALSLNFNISADLAYSCALLRQLGLTLIAWNYPSVYRVALERCDTPDSLEETLSDLLGFNPGDLGLSLARSWGLPEVLLRGMSSIAEEATVGDTLQRVCEMGELFARIQLQHYYPSRRGEWREGLDEISSYLSDEELSLLQEKVATSCSHYFQASPDIFTWPLIGTRCPRPERKTFEEYLYHNPFIKHCPVMIRAKLTDLYHELKPGVVRRELVELLVKEIIPEMRFSSGCIYTVESTSARLVPRLVISDSKKEDFRSYDLSAPYAASYSVVAAFRSEVPKEEIMTRPDGSTMSTIAGVLGDAQKTGVLYLELSQALKHDPIAKPMIYFKAARLALMDVLMLK